MLRPFGWILWAWGLRCGNWVSKAGKRISHRDLEIQSTTNRVVVKPWGSDPKQNLWQGTTFGIEELGPVIVCQLEES